MTTTQAKPVSASAVSRQLRAAGFRPIAPETKFRHNRLGLYVERCVLGEVHVGFSHIIFSARVRALADDVAATLRDLGYTVREHTDTDYVGLYVSR